MSALGTLSAGAGGVAGLLSLRRRAVPAPAAATPPQLPSVKLPDGGPLVWGRQLRPSLLLPAASQPARRHTLRQPAAAAASESAGEKRVESETESESPATQQPPEEAAASADEEEAETEKPASDSVEVEAAAESEMSTPPPPTTPETVETTTRSRSALLYCLNRARRNGTLSPSFPPPNNCHSRMSHPPKHIDQCLSRCQGA